MFLKIKCASFGSEAPKLKVGLNMCFGDIEIGKIICIHDGYLYSSIYKPLLDFVKSHTFTDSIRLVSFIPNFKENNHPLTKIFL